MTPRVALPRSGRHLVVLFRKACALVGFGVLLLACLEFSYRFQVVDMYTPELRAYNAATDLAERRDTILALGDSFTAGASYVSYLRPLLSQYRIINGGISGTGVVQAALVAPRRFKQFHPSILIYQIYVGNDLLDLRYPVNWQRLSVVRNVYWLIAERLLAVGFLNYRLGQIAYSTHSLSLAGDHVPSVNEHFSEVTYARRQVIYLKAEAGLIEDSVLVRGNRARDYHEYLGILRKMLDICKRDSCEAYILVIPHCAQVNSRYLNNYRRLGAVFSDPNVLWKVEYPFIDGLRKELSLMPNVRVVNALPVLRASEEQGQEVYYPNDEHLDSRGHEIVAGLLFSEITHSVPVPSQKVQPVPVPDAASPEPDPARTATESVF